VAVAAARLGRRAAVITRTGDDPFSAFVRRELLRLGVSDAFVSEVQGTHTTLAFCEIRPPDRFPLTFFRDATPPDLLIEARDLDLEAVATAGVFWATLSGLSRDPSRAAHLAAWEARGRRAHSVLDLDLRPSFWPTLEAARLEGRRALAHVNVVVGTLEECALIVDEDAPERVAAALLEAGVDLAVVKLGSAGVLGMTAQETTTVPAIPVDVLNGLGAGDGFGGALCHGLLAGLDLEDMLRFANAAGAIVATRHGCSTAMPTQAEVEELLARDARARATTRP
jgi:5-dehydro-2-deoxygluconokinase